jgi:hypothetical protein
MTLGHELCDVSENIILHENCIPLSDETQEKKRNEALAMGCTSNWSRGKHFPKGEGTKLLGWISYDFILRTMDFPPRRVLAIVKVLRISMNQ